MAETQATKTPSSTSKDEPSAKTESAVKTLGADLKSLQARAEKYEDLLINGMANDPGRPKAEEIAKHYRDEAAKVRAALLELTKVTSGVLERGR